MQRYFVVRYSDGWVVEDSWGNQNSRSTRYEHEWEAKQLASWLNWRQAGYP